MSAAAVLPEGVVLALGWTLVHFLWRGALDSELVSEFKSLGYENLPIDEIVAMRIHGVTSSFIRDAQKRYGKSIEIEEILELRIMGSHWNEDEEI